jgi:hypothetical protein
MLFLHNLGDQDVTADVSSLDDIAESPTEMLADRNYGDISNLERILIPGDGAAGDQGAQNRHACPAMATTRRLRPVPSQRPPGAMVSGAHADL